MLFWKEYDIVKWFIVYNNVCGFLGVSAIQVTLSDNGPAVRGAAVTFTANITSGYTGENLKFVFTDSATPQHSEEVCIQSIYFSNKLTLRHH